jgi:uncharacterized Zn finger protein
MEDIKKYCPNCEKETEIVSEVWCYDMVYLHACKECGLVHEDETWIE